MDGTTFTFLGFPDLWGKSQNGKNVVRQVTAKSRYARALAGGICGLGAAESCGREMGL
jgi:hypothetical protein